MPRLFSIRAVWAVASALAAPAFGQESPDTAEVPAYVGTETCIECHEAEHESWTGSHHDLAWTEPNPDTVLADFNDTSFTHKGVTSRFTREGDTLFIESDGPDGKITKWPVAGVIGITPLQQYFVETEPGRYQTFDVPWDTERNEWFHIYAEQTLPASDAFHWTGPYKTWNNRCAECHATDYWRNYYAATRTYSSTVSEIGVGCEACHGPGAAHLEWADEDGAALPDWPRPGLGETGLTIDYSASDPETEIQQCAGCHSRRGPLQDGSPVPGTPYHDAYRLSTLRPGLYHPDGQILDEVYVYGSFLQSKMYAAGVTCSDCHDVHSAQNHGEGNGICLACHSPAGNPDFPSVKLAEYDAPEHHFHEPDSEGAQCVSCHMIERVYMGVDGRHDHSFRIPRPDLTIATGAPNACTDCHAEEGPYWAQAEIEKRFPDPVNRAPHFATTFAAAWKGDGTVADDLVEIALSDLPGIVRASALETLVPFATPGHAAAVAGALEDPDPMVRSNAVTVQRAAAPTDMVQRLLPLLDDARRAVRQAAAREMLAAPIASMPARYEAALTSAMSEWQETLAATADFPETQLVLGGIALTTRNLQAALTAFRESVRMDPQMVQAWAMIVRIEAAAGRMDAARETLEDALRVNPGDPNLEALAAQL
ncbi:multiheme c-type cytochrome [Tropicimonas isoalkanivorans]|uniref:HEAT repeat-containing protein n=1 Tax=Tropicimonas isoalkanivorans TaxID=441112 RepID=A0A1I1GE38_9RHOB|nr:multiheme c-type cytochrome [Tropicimonas isoalkanivorans]SFC09736.1 HEAT repeat-containing protein [Tropicimonas isoalkanivorans]